MHLVIYKCILKLDQEVRLRGNWELFADIHESAPKEETGTDYKLGVLVNPRMKSAQSLVA